MESISCMLHVQTPLQESAGSMSTGGIMPIDQPPHSLPCSVKRCEVLGAYANR